LLPGSCSCLLGSSSVDAGVFRDLQAEDDFPKPIDFPDRAPEISRRPQAGDEEDWTASGPLCPVEYGKEWGKIFSARHHPVPEYLYQSQ